MTYRVHRKGEKDPVADLRTFLSAAKWCVEHASRIAGSEFVIVRHEKQGKKVISEEEATFVAPQPSDVWGHTTDGRVTCNGVVS
jgi:hypothetical protein